MSLLPVFLKLDGRQGLLVGAGKIALEKAGSLLKTGLQLRVIAPEACLEIRALAADGRLEWIERAFEPTDLDGNFVVIAATNVPAVNSAVYRGCLERGIICNSVDDIPNCDFFFGSVVSRGDLQIAISTEGESPAVAQRLRREIDAQLPQDLGPWLQSLGKLRREVLAIHPTGDDRKALLHRLAQLPLCESESCPSRLTAHRPLQSGAEDLAAATYESLLAAEGRVYLVGAGPGDPDLLTVKALRLIRSANVILHDDLVPQAILDLSPKATTVNVGKRCGSKSITQQEINALMVEHAQSGRRVVRLKSGDPLIFGRAAEEMGALREAGVAFEVIPGITSALAAAAAIPASLTDRHCASNVIFSTGHHAQSHNDAALPAEEDATRVVYMPGRDLALLAAQWLSEGLPPDLPCVLVAQAGQPEQEVFATTLGSLGEAPAMPAPSMLLAGWCLQDAAEVLARVKANLAVER